MLVLEYMGGGDLGRALSQEDKHNRQYGWYGKGRFILMCVARGLAYIHSKEVCKTLLPKGDEMYVYHEKSSGKMSKTNRSLAKLSLTGGQVDLQSGTLVISHHPCVTYFNCPALSITADGQCRALAEHPGTSATVVHSALVDALLTKDLVRT